MPLKWEKEDKGWNAEGDWPSQKKSLGNYSIKLTVEAINQVCWDVENRNEE